MKYRKLPLDRRINRKDSTMKYREMNKEQRQAYSRDINERNKARRAAAKEAAKRELVIHIDSCTPEIIAAVLKALKGTTGTSSKSSIMREQATKAEG